MDIKDAVIIFLSIALPMAAVQLLYRVIDCKGFLTKHMPFLKKHKLAWQIGGSVGFILVFGIAAFILRLDERFYFYICGGVLGLINGAAIGVMNDE